MNDESSVGVLESVQTTVAAEVVMPPPALSSTARSRQGLMLGLVSAVFYTAANICLRRVVHCDPLWVSGIKAFPTVLVAMPLLLALRYRGQSVMQPAASLKRLVWVSVAAQLFGNGMFQWSLSILGLALAIPLTLGGVLVGSAVFGYLFLKERVSWANGVSIAVLILAIVILSLGAGRASETMHVQLQKAGQPPAGLAALAVFGFFVAGVVFSWLGASIRQVAKEGLPIATILTANGVVGVAVLCSIALLRNPELFFLTSGIEWTAMLAAGLFNALAFGALTGALKRIRLLLVNAINVTQTAMAAIAGVFLFSEPMTGQLWVGVVLTGIGVLLMGRKE